MIPKGLHSDTIISCGDVVEPPTGYLKRAAEITRKAGGLFIADEVQPGFGQTSNQFWNFKAGNF